MELDKCRWCKGSGKCIMCDGKGCEGCLITGECTACCGTGDNEAEIYEDEELSHEDIKNALI